MHHHNTIASPRAYLEGLSWDGVPRLDTWLSDYLGAPDEPFTRVAGARWMISAVSRAFMPGARADGVLVLIGAPGSGKSSALRVLGGPWFEEASAAEVRRAWVGRNGSTWIWALTELNALRGASGARIKAAISATHDTYRPLYAAETVTTARACVFAATACDEGTAPGLDRRFWPVRCGRIDTMRLALVRDSLFAEAVVRHHNGEPWWMTSEDLREREDEIVVLRTDRQANQWQTDAVRRALDPDCREAFQLVLEGSEGSVERSEGEHPCARGSVDR